MRQVAPWASLESGLEPRWFGAQRQSEDEFYCSNACQETEGRRNCGYFKHHTYTPSNIAVLTGDGWRSQNLMDTKNCFELHA